ncbi:MAG: hypothetical protein IPI91_19220 [Flavobacteriales bacterium]|nr:hypothetical protein [Flavobacteriales bacterium]
MDQDGLYGMFDDEGTAMTFSVGGFGEFHMTSVSEDYTFVHAVKTSHVDSVVTVNGKSLKASTNDGADSSGAIMGKNGSLTAEFEEIESDGYGYCVYWEDGPMHVTAKRIKGFQNGAVAANTLLGISVVGKFWVQADSITCTTSDTAETVSAGINDPQAQVWIRALEISRTGGGGRAVNLGGGKVYIEAQKISASNNEAIKVSQNVATAQAWITAQKITGGSKQVLITGGTAYIDCPHLEEGPSQAVGVDVQGGTLYLNSQTMTAVNGDGVTISGGTCHINGLTIDTSGTATKNPIVKSGGTLTLNDCTLIPEATRNAVEAATAQTVYSNGSTSAFDAPYECDI